jgi:2',3'-cyclic-nucleotide 2'-phosphodiesterase (5'-nucleotidase family)
MTSLLIVIGIAHAGVYPVLASEIPSTVDLNPASLNLSSRGELVTGYIELPEPYNVADINVESVVLRVNGNTIGAEPRPYKIGDYDDDGIPDLMVKFDRQALQSHLFLGAQTLTVSGELTGAGTFKGSDTIDVIFPGKDQLRFTILQTSDVHNHASGYGPFLDYTPLTLGDDGIRGGFARLATLIGGARKEQAAAGIPTLLFDSGDFFMGTAYDLAADNPIILQFFKAMGYDAVTLGNHEFDWGSQGLALLLGNGLANGVSVPIVASNMNSNGSALDLLPAGVIVGKKIITLPNGVKIGILGLVGPDSDEKAPAASPVTFNHDYGFIQSCVNDLRNYDAVDLVVVLSHGGVENDGSGDDADLAENVSGIDIIASGHFHTATHEAVVSGGSNTVIFSPGEYGEFLSRLDVIYSPDLGRVVGFELNLLGADDTVAGNPYVQAMVELYHAGINWSLVNAGLPQLGDPITTTGFDLALTPFEVTGLGSLCADAVRNVANAVAPFNYPGSPIEIGIVPSGVIRDPILKGDTGVISFMDTYNCLPLGISPYQIVPPGYPLMHVYLNGMEIYTVCEIGLSLSRMIGSDYYLNFSGIKIVYDRSKAMSFQGVQAVYLYSPADPFCTGSATPINPSDPNRLYHIAVDFYALQMLNVLTGYGFPLTPKKGDGTPLLPSDYINYRIDATPAAGVTELKEWIALLNYLPGLGGAIPAGVYGPDGVVSGRVEYVTAP